ncbi:MAG: YkgJ family cysteine cluster protein [Cyanobacteria bacterium]|nr:YkgJ family cysteine cluster protein [Cyanobacteriota bacterium]
MANIFEKELGIPKPECCSHGECCKGASPSRPYHKLLSRAAEGDDFARGFFSIMIPYSSHEEARQVVPGLVERTLRAAEKGEEFVNKDEDVVFYHCRYLQGDNRCGVYEDRPQFCRDYPDTPFVVFAPGCAFESWGQACRVKYNEMKEEVSHLKELKEELATLKQWRKEYTNIDEKDLNTDNTTLSLVLSLTRLFVASPLCSFF